MTDVQSKLTAAFIAALMITSVASVALIAAPAAAGNSPATPDRTNWFPNDETVVNEDYSHGQIAITPAGGTVDVYQGEDEIDGTPVGGSGTGAGWVNANGTNVVGATLNGLENQGAEGESFELDEDISETQDNGVYTAPGGGSPDGQNLRIQLKEPEITSLDLINDQGQKVSGQIQEDQVLLISASWNYAVAEDLELDILNQRGTEVESTALTSDWTDLSADQRDELDGTNYNLTNNGAGPGPAGLALEDQGNGSQANLTAGDRAYWAVDLSELEDGEKTISVFGVDDLDFGIARESMTIDVTAEDDAELQIEEEEALQGDEVEFTIEKSDAGLNHVVAIEADDVRDGANTRAEQEQIFEFAGDTELVALNSDEDFVYAIVDVDPDTGVGVGIIDSQFLDDTSVDVTLYDENGSLSVTALNNTIENGNFNFFDDIDEQSLNVDEGEITITNPGATYVPNQEIDLNGTAPQGLDDVGIYARDEGDWELLLETTVENDGTFEEDDVVLTNSDELTGVQLRSDGPDLLKIPDVYRFGGIDLVDADVNDDGLADANLTSREFNRGTSDQRSLRIALPTLTGTFETYDNAIWEEDELEVEGRSIGPDRITVLFVGEKGDIIADDISVDTDDDYDEEFVIGSGENVQSINNVGNFFTETNTIREGDVLGTVLSTGRDNVFGDGVFEGASGPTGTDSAVIGQKQSSDEPDDSIERFIRQANSLSNSGRTLSQLIEIFREQTIEDEGSDDLIVTDRFRLVDDSGTSIENIVPATSPNATGIVPIEAGETAIVRGTTHLRADDNTIVVEPTNGSDANKIPVNTTENWGLDGEWNVSLDIPTDVTPGNYTIEADDPDNTDMVQMQIVAEGQRGNISTGNTQQLQNQIQELEAEVRQLTQENQRLNSTVSDLRSEVDQKDQTISELENQSADDGEDDNASDDGEEGAPGFTPVVAIVALVSAALVALRRR